jgi:adhesin transport system membrane fusion protein
LAKRKSKKGIFRRVPLPDVELATDIRTAILVQSPKGGRYILWLVLALVVVAVIWAYNSEIDQATRGRGKVIPSRQIQVVQNLEGGILAEILVAVGEIVEKGQLLLRIDDTRFSAPFRESRYRYLALRAKVARLLAETEGIDFELPPEISQENPEIVKRERDLFISRKQAFGTQISILAEQSKRRTKELAELEAKRKHLHRS